MKKPTPIITYVEILCRAIRSIEDEIRNQKEVMGNDPQFKDYLANYIAEREEKIESLKVMYRNETGNDY